MMTRGRYPAPPLHMTTQQANHQILSLLAQWVDAHPDMRFTQLLYNLNIATHLKTGTTPTFEPILKDIFFTESSTTLASLSPPIATTSDGGIYRVTITTVVPEDFETPFHFMFEGKPKRIPTPYFIFRATSLKDAASKFVSGQFSDLQLTNFDIPEIL